MSPILEIEQLKKTFHIGFLRKRVEALCGVSLTVSPGEIFGLLGPNGAGKTTLMKSMMGLIRPTSGTIRIFGMDHRRPKARAGIGYLPENPYFHEHLNAQELLGFYGGVHGLSRREIRARRGAL